MEFWQPYLAPWPATPTEPAIWEGWPCPKTPSTRLDEGRMSDAFRWFREMNDELQDVVGVSDSMTLSAGFSEEADNSGDLESIIAKSRNRMRLEQLGQERSGRHKMLNNVLTELRSSVTTGWTWETLDLLAATLESDVPEVKKMLETRGEEPRETTLNFTNLVGEGAVALLPHNAPQGLAFLELVLDFFFGGLVPLASLLRSGGEGVMRGPVSSAILSHIPRKCRQPRTMPELWNQPSEATEVFPKDPQLTSALPERTLKMRMDTTVPLGVKCSLVVSDGTSGIAEGKVAHLLKDTSIAKVYFEEFKKEEELRSDADMKKFVNLYSMACEIAGLKKETNLKYKRAVRERSMNHRTDADDVNKEAQTGDSRLERRMNAQSSDSRHERRAQSADSRERSLWSIEKKLDLGTILSVGSEQDEDLDALKSSVRASKVSLSRTLTTESEATLSPTMAAASKALLSPKSKATLSPALTAASKALSPNSKAVLSPKSKATLSPTMAAASKALSPKSKAVLSPKSNATLSPALTAASKALSPKSKAVLSPKSKATLSPTLAAASKALLSPKSKAVLSPKSKAFAVKGMDQIVVCIGIV